MRIGIIIGRIGGVDGVALETEKWITVFERMGHEIFILSGQFQQWEIDPEHDTLMPEMSFFSPESFWSQKKAFFHPDLNLEELCDHLKMYSGMIAEKMLAWVKDKKIELILVENASALPSHLEMGNAIKIAGEQLDIPIITHDHDFAWERGDRYLSPHDEVNKLVEEVFPLRLPNSFHAVINKNAQKSLKKMFNRDSVVVPNVMDFDEKFGLATDHNQNLPRDLGLDKNDMLLFQVTRIVERKGIEVAIDLIHKLDDDRIKLVITGDYKDDAGSIYFKELQEQIYKLKLMRKVIFASHIIDNKGLKGSGDTAIYSLSDGYAHARAMTYFSTYEGFGNAFVESVLARVPVFVNNYEPVYWPDIGSLGFKTVMLENNVLTDKAVAEMKEITYNDKLNKEIADYNYELGKKHFSYVTLQEKLQELIDISRKL